MRTPLPWWRPTVRTSIHVLCLAPLAAVLALLALDRLGANPVEALIRDLGDWALRFMVLGLAITPMRRLTGFSALAQYRRMVGLWAFAYAGLHLLAYVVLDQFFDWTAIGNDIIKHKFITAGMASLLLMLPLAATSTMSAIRRLGGQAWRRLHRLVYVAAPLAALHYAWMVKADLTEPVVYGTIMAALLGLRVIWVMRRATSVAVNGR